MKLYPQPGMLRGLTLGLPASLVLWAGILWAVERIIQ
jgi:hypothetical protein